MRFDVPIYIFFHASYIENREGVQKPSVRYIATSTIRNTDNSIRYPTLSASSYQAKRKGKSYLVGRSVVAGYTSFLHISETGKKTKPGWYDIIAN